MKAPLLKTYEINYSEVVKANNPEHYFKAVHIYKFSTAEENRYLVTVEEYQHNLFVLKFCLENHKDNEDKFNVQINIGYAQAKKVILTCVQIGLSIYEKNPLASFGFVASPTADELDKTGFTNTKRLLVYKPFVQLFFQPENFAHSHSEQHSSYLILNKKYELQEPDAKQKMTTMLQSNLNAVTGNP